jgi:ethanolamine ammonia-lyase large subunit
MVRCAAAIITAAGIPNCPEVLLKFISNALHTTQLLKSSKEDTSCTAMTQQINKQGFFAASRTQKHSSSESRTVTIISQPNWS